MYTANAPIIDSIVHYGLGPALGFICFFVSKYFHGYLTAKGKQLATKEDFSDILNQLRITAQATEEIKSRFSHVSWINQQHWGVREKLYTDILTQLTILKNTCQDRLDYYQQPGSEHDPNIPCRKHYLLLTQKGREAFLATRELSGPAAVFLSENTIRAIDELISDSWMSEMGAACEKEHVEWIYEAASKAYNFILSEAKRDISNLSSHM